MNNPLRILQTLDRHLTASAKAKKAELAASNLEFKAFEKEIKSHG